MKINYGKKDIATDLSFKTGYSVNYSQKLINELLKVIIKNISYDNLILKNFGVFRIIEKKKRIGRNPKTKEEYVIPNKKTIKFIPSKNLTKFLNKYNG